MFENIYQSIDVKKCQISNMDICIFIATSMKYASICCYDREIIK